MPDVLTIVGARPQFIKASAVSRALAARGLREMLVHTGQHFDADMSRVFFDELGLRAPDHHLGIAGGTHAEMTARMLPALEQVIVTARPAVVMVFGDTNSTLAGSLAAAKLNVPVAHVEAGLRSRRRSMPEEINRVVTDHVSTLLLCPTPGAVANLEREGIRSAAWNARPAAMLGGAPIALDVGDVMLDVLRHHRDAAERSGVLSSLGLVRGGYGVLTIHRAENTESREQLVSMLEQVAGVAADFPVVFPVHPRTSAQLGEETGRLTARGIRIVAPLSYLDFLHLQMHARVMMTDSGGVQKEAFFLGVPCVTLRDETEWMETVDAGANVLAGNAPRALRDIVHRAGVRREWSVAAFGDGHAAVRIAEVLS